MKKHNLVEELSNAEVYEMAGTLLRQYGKDAGIVASMQAGEKLSMGDIAGYRTWKRLVMLVDGIFEIVPAAQDCVH